MQTSSTRAVRVLCVCGLLFSACTGQVVGQQGTASNAGGWEGIEDRAGNSGTQSRPDSNSASPSVPTSAPTVCAAPSRRIWKLTPSQIEKTLALVVDGPLAMTQVIDTLSKRRGGFSNEVNRLEMSVPHVTALHELADVVSERVAASPMGVACSAKVDCFATLFSSLSTRLWRRPFTMEEQRRFEDFFNAEKSDSDAVTAVKELTRAMTLSPHFLYRTEVGDPLAKAGDSTALSSWERAQSLSYFLTDAPPDKDLQMAALLNHLGTQSEVMDQANRLLSKPQSALGLRNFISENFSSSAIKGIRNRDAALYPQWDEPLAKGLADESEAFVVESLWGNDAAPTQWKTLLTANFSMLNEKTAKLYGVNGIKGTETRRVSLPTGQRAGILTQGSFLALAAHDKEGDVVARGKFLRERLLCETIPPPPPNVNAVIPTPAAGQSLRDRMVQHSADPTCRVCHNLMDPLGFAFLNYDAIGAFRATDAGKPVDASGGYTDEAGANEKFSDAIGLMEKLAASTTAANCFTGRMFQYAQGREANEDDACLLTDLRQKFLASKGNITSLAAETAAKNALAQRKVP